MTTFSIPLQQALHSLISRHYPFKKIEESEITLTIEEKVIYELGVRCLTAYSLFNKIKFEAFIDPSSGQAKAITYNVLNLPKTLFDLMNKISGAQTFILRSKLVNGYYIVTTYSGDKSFRFISNQTGDKTTYYDVNSEQVPTSDPVYKTMRHHASIRIKYEWPFKQVDESTLELKIWRRETTGFYLAETYTGDLNHEKIDGALVGFCKFNEESYRVDADPFGDHVKALVIFPNKPLSQKALDYIQVHFGENARITQATLECYGMEITVKIGGKEYFIFETKDGIHHQDQYPFYLSI